MEEFIGKIWHNWVTKAAGGHYPQAAVKLAEVEKTAGILFRAFGGDPGLKVAAATAEQHGARVLVGDVAHEGVLGDHLGVADLGGAVRPA